MAQLIVRNLDKTVVMRLRRRAAEQGVSVEEAHRRLLRDSLLGGGPGPKKSFIDYLRSIPQGEPIEFQRAADRPREVDL